VVFIVLGNTIDGGLLILPGYGAVFFAVAFAIVRTCESMGMLRPLHSMLSWVGLFSYEIFLLHEPLITSLNRQLFAPLVSNNSTSMVALGGGIAIGLAITAPLAVMLSAVRIPRLRYASSLSAALPPTSPAA
jgi:peptidoglycan/LPS O-acetylase OafA/YrhL